jgi:hypothetical protein
VAALWGEAARVAHPATAAEAPLVLKGGTAQLFVDDYLIASQEGLTRTLRQPKKDADA